MKIKSFGCSFIYGTDLSDNPQVWNYSNLTWPALLAARTGSDYECHARPGSGNLQIAERVLNQCADDDSSFYIIDWTWIDRFDYIKRQDDQWLPWDTLRPSSNSAEAVSYYKHLHSEYSDKFSTLSCIKMVLDVLLEKGLDFIMTYEDDLIFDQRWHVSPAVNYLQNSVRPYMTTFEGQSFLAWSRSKNFPESPGWHPLEEAHESAADLMIKVFDRQKTNDPVRQAHV
jgi:hypothetical protein